MKVTQTTIPEVLILEPSVFQDERGFFFESFNQKMLNEIVGKEVTFVQDNHSKSKVGVLRGLHYQLPPMAQGKLVRCLVGELYDVAVDIRRNSPTFGSWVGEVLSAENKKQMWIPEGFAHGFLTLSNVVEVLYKTTNYYSPEHARAIKWDDPVINIEWPVQREPVLSEKDISAPCLNASGTPLF